jgi:hypothetical protein
MEGKGKKIHLKGKKNERNYDNQVKINCPYRFDECLLFFSEVGFDLFPL